MLVLQIIQRHLCPVGNISIHADSVEKIFTQPNGEKNQQTIQAFEGMVEVLKQCENNHYSHKPNQNTVTGIITECENQVLFAPQLSY